MHADMMGPIAAERPEHLQYSNTSTDHKTRWKDVYLFRKKGDDVEALRMFNLDVDVPCYHRIQRLCADKGGEFTKEKYRQLCQRMGVRLEFSVTATPQTIGGIETRWVRTTRCLLRDGGFSKNMWGEMMITAAYLANGSPHSAL